MYNSSILNLNTLGDKVWNDVNDNGLLDGTEAGIGNITVRLLNNLGVAVNNPATGKPYVVVTDAAGMYKFVDLPDGLYIVEFANLPTGFQFSTKDASGTGNPGSATDGTLDSDVNPATGRTGIIDLGTASATDVNLTNVDAGIVQGTPAGTASLGNKVWYDLNNNGIQDGTELGVGKVQVTLLDGTGAVVNVPGTSTPYIIYTNALGEYLFTNLPAGDYQVRFGNFPIGYTSSAANAGTDDTKDADANYTGASSAATTATTATYSLKTGEDNLTVDMGIVPAAGTNALGNFVWKDTNGDGIQTAGEPGVQGVTVTLYNNAGVAIAVTTTDKNGAYAFVGLPDGTYTVGFSNLPDGFVLAPKNASGSTTANDSDADAATGRTSPIVLVGGVTNNDIDAGLQGTRAAIGNYVWLDTNGDGIQDATEKPVSGVTVILYAADGVTPVASAITDATGNYFFGNLAPATYVVGFSTVPGAVVFTQQNTPGDNGNNTNSDANPATGLTSQIVLSPSETDLTVDAGLKPNNPASVGDLVWNDLDNDGVKDANEPGLPGIIVTLYNSANVVVGTAVTDGNGNYLISNVPPATGYYIRFSNLPIASPTVIYTTQTSNVTPTDGTNGSDPSPSGQTAPFDLAAGQYLPHVDAGIVNVKPLPVKLISFTALPNGNKVNVEWTVGDQANVASYEVEYSVDGRTFSKIDIATVSSASRYNSLHGSPVAGVNFYRLRIIGKDGEISFSDIRKVNFGKGGTVVVFPIPATNVVNITLTGNMVNKAATVSFIAMDGKVVNMSKIAVTGQTESFNVSNLASGTYIVRIATNDTVSNTTIEIIK
jgi:SdrD B-like domain/Secretion system C-terminal sorting domain